ncbi:AMP-binding protein [Paraburkholderia tropica]|uniref:Long-chain acyl-CoA synthetase (AMP-forming) n=1 Tax=Paraburkholderia tropica TaxID=92647 RepID=A0AAQ1JXN7_9BURK|nr:AMP-binding protein [Paraburkholderia tropica]RQN37249.1 hypothetical protein EHZ25_20070 [Paraburkholderia tropica]SEK13055.1 Long-chain acyl-CoA synthetase (AMP-forming) [Paraburkholderia tropica]
MNSEILEARHRIIASCIDGLYENHKNRIIFWDRNSRSERSFSEFRSDLQVILEKINTLTNANDVKRISIIGPTCYEWFLIDVACIYCGLMVHAIPESVSTIEYEDLLTGQEIDLEFVHVECSRRINISRKVVFFGDFSSDLKSNHLLHVPQSIAPEPRAVQGPHYSYAFSSGTQGRQKLLKLPYPDLELSRGKLGRDKGRDSRSEPDSIFIWMSFSHYLQRWFSLQALFLGFDLIISKNKDAVVNIMRERPTVMASAAILYEMIAWAAERKISGLRADARFALNVFNFLKINRFHYKNPVRRLFDFVYLKNLTKLYGGRPEQFIWSGSCVKEEALRTLDRIGLQVYGGYALSELGPISTDRRESFRLGSVGRPTQKIKISESGEILVKWSESMRDASNLLIDSEGYVHTGDLGYLDQDGYLFVEGRKDDIIVLSTGKNIIPVEIEGRIRSVAGVSDAIIYSDDDMYLKVILEIDGESIDSHIIRDSIGKINGRLRDYEKIISFKLMGDFRSVEGVVTPSEKIKRRAIVTAARSIEEIMI